TLTIFHVLSGDPIPQKSDKLYHVQLDPQSMDGYTPGEEPENQVTRYDAEELLRQKRGDRQAMMSGGSVAVDPERPGLSASLEDARFTSSDFFPMFDVPFLHGSGWAATDDGNRARVAVVTKGLNERLFNGGNSVGRSVRLDGTEFRVV